MSAKRGRGCVVKFEAADDSTSRSKRQKPFDDPQVPSDVFYQTVCTERHDAAHAGRQTHDGRLGRRPAAHPPSPNSILALPSSRCTCNSGGGGNGVRSEAIRIARTCAHVTWNTANVTITGAIVFSGDSARSDMASRANGQPLGASR